MPKDDETGSHDQAFWRFGRTRKAQGGIKSQQAARGRGAQQTWWAQRWIAVLESFDIGARLDRGRSYARRGQVLNISVDKGQVLADVQGSQRKPYQVIIRLKTLGADDWRKVAVELAGKAVYAAKLAARQMPQQIEEAFTAVGLSLFPLKQADLETKCSCPDWSNPCKHVAAVYYLLGEEFDRDPFLIFKMRGSSEDELLKLLDEELGVETAVAAAEPPALSQVLPAGAGDGPLSAEHEKFWRAGPLPADSSGGLSLPPAHAVLVRSLGSFPFWRGEQQLWPVLEHLYKTASGATRDLYADLMAENTKEPIADRHRPM